MKSILKNETQFNSCDHSYFQSTEWTEFEKNSDLFISNLRRWTECKICGKQNFLSIKERKSYGIIGFRGNIQDILNGEEVNLAFKLLVELIKGKNNKRWQQLRKKLLQEYPYEILEEVKKKLHMYGILIYREEKEAVRWKVKQVKYNEKYVNDIYKFVEWIPADIPIWMSHPFPTLPLPKTENGELVYKLIQAQKNKFFQNGKGEVVDLNGNLIVSSTTSKRGYFKFIRILYGLFENIELQQKEYWKTFSQKIFSNTKIIQPVDKKRIIQYFGDNFEVMGIISDKSEVVLSGQFTWVYDGHSSTSLAFKDYTTFQRDMIKDMKLTSWSPSSILIIENPDLYFPITKSKLLKSQEWSIILGNGYISSQEMEVVYQACNFGLKEVYIWPDLDPYGLNIAIDICNKLKQYEVSVYLFGFSMDWFKRVGIYKSLEQVDISEIDKLLCNSKLHGKIRLVLEEMKAKGKKAEQEILFASVSSSEFDLLLKKESILLK